MVDHKYEQQKAFQELQLSKTFSYGNFMATSPASFLGAVPAAFPANGSERIQKLLSHSILDTASETIYDDITEVAAYICGTATSLVSLVDVSRQWFKSTVGLDAMETPRDMAFCAHATLRPEVLVVPDARADERFANNPHQNRFRH